MDPDQDTAVNEDKLTNAYSCHTIFKPCMGLKKSSNCTVQWASCSAQITNRNSEKETENRKSVGQSIAGYWPFIFKSFG